MVEARHIGHDGLLVRTGSAHNVCRSREEAREEVDGGGGYTGRLMVMDKQEVELNFLHKQ